MRSDFYTFSTLQFNFSSLMIEHFEKSMQHLFIHKWLIILAHHLLFTFFMNFRLIIRRNWEWTNHIICNAKIKQSNAIRSMKPLKTRDIRSRKDKQPKFSPKINIIYFIYIWVNFWMHGQWPNNCKAYMLYPNKNAWAHLTSIIFHIGLSEDCEP